MVLTIDGSMGEGGGQILRTSLGLSGILGIPVKIINIRAKRRNPGLQRQHLTAVNAVAMLTNAKVDGAYVGSTTLYFEPRTLRGGKFEFNIGTAGSTTLVLQAILPLLPFLPSSTEITIRGGTDVPWSPPIDYVRYVFVPILRMFGLDLEVELIRRGHYPRGGGVIKIRILDPPHRLKSVEFMDRGNLVKIYGRSHCVKLPRHVAERQAKSARELLEEYLRSKGISVDVEIETEWYEPSKDPHLGPGSGITLCANFQHSVIGADALGERGKPAEKVGEEAAKKLIEELESGAAIDRHAGDMVVALAALAQGTSRFYVSQMTLHTKTVIDLVKIFLGEQVRIALSSDEIGKSFTMEIRGIGLEK